jgi:hypothetical protein
MIKSHDIVLYYSSFNSNMLECDLALVCAIIYHFDLKLMVIICLIDDQGRELYK